MEVHCQVSLPAVAPKHAKTLDVKDRLPLEQTATGVGSLGFAPVQPMCNLG